MSTISRAYRGRLANLQFNEYDPYADICPDYMKKRDFHLPKGFSQILLDLSREVLREQPEDVLGFAAIYFENLVQAKDGCVRGKKRAVMVDWN